MSKPGRPIGFGLLLLLIGGLAGSVVRAKPPVSSKAVSSDVPLSPDLIRRARRNRALFQRAAASQEAFCAFVADSVALLQPLTDAVTRGVPSDPDPEGGPYGAGTAGVGVDVFEGGVHASLQWKNLLAVATPPGRALVLATQALVGDTCFGVWTEQQSDYGGCHRPELALPVLKGLGAAWRDAPACLRAALKPELVRMLTWMAEDGCFCAPSAKKDEVQRLLGENAAVLERIPDLGSPFAGRLRALASSPTATFQCPGPG